MSKSQKRLAEKKHRMVYNFLVKNFPGCNVRYNGEVGVDHSITFNDKTVILETKTCKRTIRGGIKRVENRPVLDQKFRLGRFRFTQRKLYPYNMSQHHDLVNSNGWYIFVIGYKIFGCLASDVDVLIGGDWDYKLISWPEIVAICYPDWIRRLRGQVYGV